jgi:hypothetical protein
MHLLQQPWRLEYNKMVLQESLFPVEKRKACTQCPPSKNNMARYREIDAHLRRRLSEASENPNATQRQQRMLFLKRLIDKNLDRISQSDRKITYFHEVNDYLRRRMCEVAKNPGAAPEHKQERAVFLHKLLDANMGRIFHARSPDLWGDPQRAKLLKTHDEPLGKKRGLAVQKQPEQKILIPKELLMERPIEEERLAYA